MKRAAVFLDRDGTLNEEIGYLSRADDLLLIRGAGEAVRRINQAGMAAVVVTNQSGVARGYFEERALLSIHKRLRQELEKEGAYLDGIYICPHHPQGDVDGYRRVCQCRKPGIGMVREAERDLSLELSLSYMIGDHLNDVRMAVNAGMRSVLILTGHGSEEWERVDDAERSMPTHVAGDITEAVDWILSNRAESGKE